MKSYRLPMWWMLMLTVIRNYLRGRGEYELFVLDLIQEYLRYFRVKEARSFAGEMWFGFSKH